jgi:hypothetical protein
MHLTTPVMVVRRIFVGGAQRSTNKEFFPSSLFSLSPPRKTYWPLPKKKKKTKKSNYLFVKLN